MGKIGTLIAAFLDSYVRKQEFIVEGRLSSLVNVLSGVPQGTVLGPVLFLIHIRNLHKSISEGTYPSSFADDTKIWRGSKTPEGCQQLQEDLQSVYSLADTINMLINEDKFE